MLVPVHQPLEVGVVRVSGLVVVVVDVQGLVRVLDAPELARLFLFGAPKSKSQGEKEEEMRGKKGQGGRKKRGRGEGETTYHAVSHAHMDGAGAVGIGQHAQRVVQLVGVLQDVTEHVLRGGGGWGD